MATYEKVSHFQRLKNNMKGMSFKEKIAHLWEYYKWIAITAVLLIITTVSVVTSVIENSKELVYGGVIVNLVVTEEGKTYLKEGWFEALDSDPKKQKIELDEIHMPNIDQPTVTESSMANSAKITAMITAGHVDYVLMDAAGVDYLSRSKSFSPLNEVLPEEQLQKLENKIIPFQSEDEEYPIAILISDLPFVKKHIGSKDKVYIAFPGNTGRTERNAAFLEYLLNWSES